MSNKRNVFTQSDVSRALTAARKANFHVAACSIRQNGEIRLIFANPISSASPELADWDEVLR